MLAYKFNRLNLYILVGRPIAKCIGINVPGIYYFHKKLKCMHCPVHLRAVTACMPPLICMCMHKCMSALCNAVSIIVVPEYFC